MSGGDLAFGPGGKVPISRCPGCGMPPRQFGKGEARARGVKGHCGTCSLIMRRRAMFETSITCKARRRGPQGMPPFNFITIGKGVEVIVELDLLGVLGEYVSLGQQQRAAARVRDSMRPFETYGGQ